METRSRHENFRLRQSSVMVRRSHVAMEFISVAIGSIQCASDKLVTIRHSACDKTLGACKTKHSARDRVDLSRQRILCHDRLLTMANSALCCALFE